MRARPSPGRCLAAVDGKLHARPCGERWRGANRKGPALLRDLSVLVVEDHDFQREMILGMLARLNARGLHSAADGQAALDILQAQPIDIIISDIDMPGMDGLEFMRRLAQSRNRASVIIVSAIERGLLESTEAMVKAYGINLLGVIGKPVTRASLACLLVRHAPPAGTLQQRPVTYPSFSLDEIKAGLERRQFEAFYQPKVDLATCRVVGAEALARWRHPRLGIVAPGAFLPKLEESGDVDQLMWQMLDQAAGFCSTLNACGVESSVAVNLSLRSLNNFDLAKGVYDAVLAQRLSSSKVCLEITESAATTNLGAALENLTRLRMKGFTLSIDDFGTGYSSMQQLTRVPFTELKIDRSFVSSSANNEAARVILRSSLQMARDLNIKAVAEGVETRQEWELLQELGCDLAQGYFIAKPMHARAYMAWIRTLGEDPKSMFTA